MFCSFQIIVEIKIIKCLLLGVERVGISVHHLINMPMMSAVLMKHLIDHQRPPLAIKENNLMMSMKKKKIQPKQLKTTTTVKQENIVDTITDSQPFDLKEMDSGNVKQEQPSKPRLTRSNAQKITKAKAEVKSDSSSSEGDSGDDDD